MSRGAARVAERFVALERRGGRQTVFANGSSATAATVSSTTNTGDFVTALAWVWTELPDGLYVVRMDTTLLLGHSAGGQVSMRAVGNGVAGTTYNPTAPNTSPATMPFRILQLFTEVEAINGAGITLETQYKGLDAGTTSARNPAISATAIKVG